MSGPEYSGPDFGFWKGASIATVISLVLWVALYFGFRRLFR